MSLRIVVSGMVAADPWQGGASWAPLQYVAGLRRLGHEVTFIEPVPAQKLLPAGTSLATSENARYFRSLPFVGSDERSALLLAGGRDTAGATYERLRELVRGADLLLNLSGLLSDEALLDGVGVRAFVDLDPGFNQGWAESGEDVGLERHSRFVTVGLRVGEPDCLVPTCGRDWIRTLPPVVLEHWPASGRPSVDAFTSVGNWRSYGTLVHGGITYGQRAHSFRELVELPRRTEERLRMALAIHPDEERDLMALEANGWELADPAEVAGTPERYRGFIQASKAELGIAKHGYVSSGSGWFSDRTACYLASGRPAVCQETGFARQMETGRGLLSYSNADEAAAAIEAVAADWDAHSEAARAIAEDALDSDRVLSRLLEECVRT